MSEKKKYRIAPGQKHYMPAPRVKGQKGRRKNMLFTEGQIVELHDHNVKGIRDKLIPVDETLDVANKNLREPDITPDYKIEHRGGGWYSVINTATGKAVNEDALKKANAEELVAELTAEEE